MSHQRRGHGEGSIYRRLDGRWTATIDLGWQGGRRRRKFLYGKTRAEVAQKLAVEERLLLGLGWDDHGLVFTNTVGKPLHPSNFLQRSFYPLLARAGLPRIRFHDLRHSAATLLLGLGIHPKIVSEMLGHSQIGITLDLYSHVTATMQQEAVRAFDGLFGSQVGSQEGASEH
jgi:integrase